MIFPVIFFTSAAVLAYEITFTRIYSFAQWHNLSSVIITLALLGAGASGTVIALAGEFIQKNFFVSSFAMALMFPLFMAGGFILSAVLPVNPYSIGFSISQVIYMFIYFLLMCLPFFAGSAIVCISFTREAPSGVYAVNLFGAGAGGVLPLLLSYYIHPYSIMAVVIVMSFFPALILAAGSSKKISWVFVSTLCPLIAAAMILSIQDGFRKVSQYKPVSGALNLPGAVIINETYSPLSVVQVVGAEGLRSTSGLSLVSPFEVPVQRVMFFDGDSPSPITPFSGKLNETEYIILSHGHYDHTGGLRFFKPFKALQSIYIHKDAFKNKYAKEKKIRYNGIPFKENEIVWLKNYAIKIENYNKIKFSLKGKYHYNNFDEVFDDIFYVWIYFTVW